LGNQVGGWIVALPLTSGPISVFFALQHGPEFAAQAAIGTLAGSVATCAFCLGYGFSAPRFRWPISLTLGLLSFFTTILILKPLSLGLWSGLIVVFIVNIGSLRLLPKPPLAVQPFKPGWWDIPLRMILATILVLTITGLSNNLGPDWSGLLSPIPLFISLLTAFAHQSQGSNEAVRTLRGTLMGTFAFAIFFFVVHLTVTQLSLVVTYTLAAVIAILVNGLMQKLLNDKVPK
jgi:hypothetical protein